MQTYQLWCVAVAAGALIVGQLILAAKLWTLDNEVEGWDQELTRLWHSLNQLHYRFEPSARQKQVVIQNYFAKLEDEED